MLGVGLVWVGSQFVAPLLGVKPLFGAWHEASTGSLYTGDRLLALGIGFGVAFPVMVFASVFQTAFVYALYERMDGRRATKRAALARAMSKFVPLLVFNVVGSLVGIVFAILGEALNKLRIIPYLGSMAEVVGMMAFAVANFFVLPIYAVEDVRSYRKALSSSVALARSHWGKSLSGIVTISAAVVGILLLTFGALFLLTIGAVVFAGVAGWEPGIWMVWIFLTPFLAMLAFALLFSLVQQAAIMAYQTGLYRYARTGRMGGAFTAASLVEPWLPYQQGADPYGLSRYKLE